MGTIVYRDLLADDREESEPEPAFASDEDDDEREDDAWLCMGESGAMLSDEGDTLLGEDEERGGVEREQSLLSEAATSTYSEFILALLFESDFES